MRQDQNQFTRCLEKPIAYNFYSRKSWSTVSNALCKTIKIMTVIKPWSKSLRILSFKKERQKTEESSLGKPD